MTSDVHDDVHVGARVRVLVVDDAPELRTLLRILFEDAGAEVEEAAGAPEALARLSARVGPDITHVVLDHRMPGMTGLEAARALREQGDDRRLVLWSGSVPADLEEAAAALRMQVALKDDLRGLVGLVMDAPRLVS